MKKIASLIILFLAVLSSSAQVAHAQKHYCFTDEVWTRMVQKDSSLLIKRQQMDAAIARLTRNRASSGSNNEKSATSAPATVVPTVIYIVYDTATVNISMTQIQSQMDQLNQNFALYGYSFCYAKLNVTNGSAFVPQAGDSAGVFRIQSPLSNVDAYTTDAQLKALSTLPSENYLRIFVVHTISPQGVLGYTIWPGTDAATDGIVILSDVFGSNNYCNACQLYPQYNLGAAMTHEAGHFFDLYHTFQGGCDTGSGLNACQIFGDQVCDTPPTDGSFGCPSPAPLSCDGINPELIQNYMDYTDDPCKNSFTAGQKERMDYGTNLYHSNLVSTQNLINTGVTCVSLNSQYSSFYCADFDGCLNAPLTFASLGNAGFTYQWNFGDGSSATGDTVSHTFTTDGKFLVSLTATNASMGVTSTGSNPVFITDCRPIDCSTNKIDFNFGYMDFSSGTPVAVNHAPEVSSFPDGLYYSTYYRGVGHGDQAFIIGDSPHGLVLFDSSFNSISTFEYGTPYILFPLPGNKGEYCYIYGLLTPSGASNDSDVYCIIETDSGAVHVRGDRNNIYFGQSIPQEFVPVIVGVVAIPNCDGTKEWVISQPDLTTMNIYEIDSSANFTFIQTYSLPAGYQCTGLKASPDGRKIISAYYNSGTADIGFALLDFDKSNGSISGISYLDEGQPAGGAYIGCNPSFSPNSRFVYASGGCCFQATGSAENVYQYDLQSADPVASRKSLYQYTFGTSQGFPNYYYYTGPDNKVYIGHQTEPGNSAEAYRFSTINFPDIPEDGNGSTGFNLNGPDIRPVNCPYSIGSDGFNCFLDQPDANGCNWQPGVPQPFSSQATSCLGYQFYSDACYSAVWDFGDANSGSANSSTLNSPTHSFSAPGAYIVKLISSGYSFTDTIYISAPSVQIASTPISPCPSPLANYSIANIQSFVSYNWTITNGLPANAQGVDNINVQWNTNDTFGTVTVVALNAQNGCADTSVLPISYSINGTVSINNISATICPGSGYSFNNRNLTTAGYYSDTLSSSGGCTSINILHLQIGQLPAVTWPGNNDTISNTTSPIQLTGGNPPGGTYSGSGVTGNTFYPDSAAAGSYTVTYTYTDSIGCSSSAYHIFVVAGINDISIEDMIRLYPDPAKNTVTVQSDLFNSATTQILLYDMIGRLITVPVQKYSGQENFDISNLSNGVYCFKILINGKEAAKRFVKIE